MEGSVAADSADQEYMTMDADKLSGHEDIYENGDILDHDLTGKVDSSGHESNPESRGRTNTELKKAKIATNACSGQNTQNPTIAEPAIPLADRYIPIQHPSNDAKRGQRTPQLVFLRRTTVCLVLLCILLLGGMLGQSFSYNRLSEIQMRMAERLHEENNKLKEEIDNLRNHSTSTGHDLFILKDFVLEEQIKEELFRLVNETLKDFSSLKIEMTGNISSSGNTTTLRPDMTNVTAT